MKNNMKQLPPAFLLCLEAATETSNQYRDALWPFDGDEPKNTVDSNTLNGFLAVFAQESLEQFIAAMPPIGLFTKNFDSEIMNGGASVTTRLSNTNFGAPNDLSLGYGPTNMSSSTVIATLKLRDYDAIFNELEWATATPQVLINTFFKPMAGQLANGVVVDCLQNVTTASFANYVTVSSSAAFYVTGSNLQGATGSCSLQAVSTILTNLEIPFKDRYAIVSPLVYQSLVSGILPTYLYGSPAAVQMNEVQKLVGFDLHQYARFYGASLPQGGSSVTGAGGKIIGICGQEQGLVLAMRQPINPDNGLVMASTAVDPTSKISLQTRMVYDASKPGWRLLVVALWGSAAGNGNAIVPILTGTTS